MRIRARAVAAGTVANWAADYAVVSTFLGLTDAMGDRGAFLLCASASRLEHGAAGRCAFFSLWRTPERAAAAACAPVGGRCRDQRGRGRLCLRDGPRDQGPRARTDLGGRGLRAHLTARSRRGAARRGRVHLPGATATRRLRAGRRSGRHSPQLGRRLIASRHSTPLEVRPSCAWWFCGTFHQLLSTMCVRWSLRTVHMLDAPLSRLRPVPCGTVEHTAWEARLGYGG